MTEITDINDPRIALYRTLRRTPQSHIDNDVFVAEGRLVFERLMHSSVRVRSVFALPEFYEEYSELINNKNIPDDNLYHAGIKLMNQIVGFRLHSGIMAIGEIPAPIDYRSLEPPFVMMNAIVDSENVGAIVRNCAGFGIRSIVHDNATSSPWLRRAVRVSMGGVFYTHISSVTEISDCYEYFYKNNIKIIAAEITPKSIPLNEFRFPEKFALVFGSEG
ncbi:MAG: TrmH family RNA methyltransferase, partial [Bacteroidota bacterium]